MPGPHDACLGAEEDLQCALPRLPRLRVARPGARAQLQLLLQPLHLFVKANAHAKDPAALLSQLAHEEQDHVVDVLCIQGYWYAFVVPPT